MKKKAIKISRADLDENNSINTFTKIATDVLKRDCIDKLYIQLYRFASFSIDRVVLRIFTIDMEE